MGLFLDRPHQQRDCEGMSRRVVVAPMHGHGRGACAALEVRDADRGATTYRGNPIVPRELRLTSP